MGRHTEQQDFIINSLKADICLLRESINQINVIASSTLNHHEYMNDVAEGRLENKSYKDYIENEIKYPGEMDIYIYIN